MNNPLLPFARLLFAGISLLLVVTGIAFAVSAVAQQPSGLKQLRQIKQAIDNNELTQARSALDAALAAQPESPALLFELARYHMVAGSVMDDSIPGFTYNKEADQAALAALDRILAIDSGHANAHALAVLLHAIQGRLDSAEASVAKARETYQKPIWLDFNEAVLRIRQKQYAEAADLLIRHTSVHPKKNKTEELRVYGAAWRLLRRLAVKHPELDPVPAVRNGLIKRVLIEDYEAYIEKRGDQAKPLYVHFASSDNWCSFCIQNLDRVEAIARRHPDKFDFIHVSFEPWTSLKSYRDQLPDNLRGLPVQVFIAQGVEQARVMGLMSPEAIEALVEREYAELKSGRLGERRRALTRKKVLAKIDDKYRAYLKKHGHYRAGAVAIESGGRWVSGYSSRLLTQALANESALANCEKRRKHSQLTEPCDLFAVDSTIVIDMPADRIAELTALAKRTDSPVDEPLGHYHKKAGHKAFAFARNLAGNWVSFYAYGKTTDAEAAAAAIAGCERLRRKKRLPDPCEIYFANDDAIKPLVFE